MKKRLFTLCCTAFIAASPAFAANPFDTTPPAPAAINIYDWYNLGEYVAAASQAPFNQTVYQQMDESYKKVYDLMIKTHVSDTTLSAFKQWYPVLKALPWDKDWTAWTKEQQTIWQQSPLQVAWYKGVMEDASHAVESLVFYWLGHHSLLLEWAVPIYQSWGWADGIKNTVNYAATDLAVFATDPKIQPIFSALTPDVQSAIVLIGSAKKKLSGVTDPFGKTSDAGLTADDVAKLVDAAKRIRAAAQANQLTK